MMQPKVLISLFSWPPLMMSLEDMSHVSLAFMFFYSNAVQAINNVVLQPIIFLVWASNRRVVASFILRYDIKFLEILMDGATRFHIML